MSREPNATDRLVGENIRVRRISRGLSQARVAEELGITPQQIQKYEKGVNRIGAVRLYQIANILEISTASFFQRNSFVGESEQEGNWLFDPALKRMATFLDTPEGTRLVSAFTRINDAAMRYQIIKFVSGVADLQMPRSDRAARGARRAKQQQIN